MSGIGDQECQQWAQLMSVVSDHDRGGDGRLLVYASTLAVQTIGPHFRQRSPGLVSRRVRRSKRISAVRTKPGPQQPTQILAIARSEFSKLNRSRSRSPRERSCSPARDHMGPSRHLGW
jgi:hypothetical protein